MDVLRGPRHSLSYNVASCNAGGGWISIRMQIVEISTKRIGMLGWFCSHARDYRRQSTGDTVNHRGSMVVAVYLADSHRMAGHWGLAGTFCSLRHSAGVASDLAFLIPFFLSVS